MSNNAFFLPEAKALIAEEDKYLIVQQFLASGETTIDMEQGDRILMINGKRVSNLEEINMAYDNIDVGDEMKIGIQREESRFIVSLVKEKKSEGVKTFSIKNGQPVMENGEGIIPVLTLGLMLSEQEDGLSLVRILPSADQSIKDLNLKKGVHLVAIDNEPIKTSTEMKKKLDSIEYGDELTLIFNKGGEEISVKVEKQKITSF